MAYLEVIAGPDDKGKRLPISVGVWVIGRDPGVAMQLLDKRVSRHHLRIVHRSPDDPYIAEDMESEAGTRLRGTLISARTALSDGDQLVLGDTTILFGMESAKRVDPPLISTKQRTIPTIKSK